MTFTEKAKELMKGCKTCQANYRFYERRGGNQIKDLWKLCEIDRSKISQMREDLQAFRGLISHEEIRAIYAVKRDISQALKVLDGGKI